MKLVDYEKYYHLGSEFIIPRDEFEKIIEENQRLKEEYIMLQNASEEYEDKLLKEKQRLNNIIYTTLEYVDREEVSSVGTPFTSTSIGKEIKELLEGEKSFNSIWEENQRLNNVLNELEKDIKNLYTYGIKNNSEQKDYLLNRLEGLKEFYELKESDK